MQEPTRVLGHLRAIQTQELTLILSWRNAPNVRANMYTRHEITLEEHLAWWEKIRPREDQVYRIYEHQGRPLGVVAFNGIDRIHRNSSWAFYSSPEAPRGTGGRMEFLALDYAFDVIGLHKLNCDVLAFNQPVIRLHEKFGFKLEGHFREQHMGENQFVDIYRLGILAREWQNTRQAMLARVIQKLNRRITNNEYRNHNC